MEGGRPSLRLRLYVTYVSAIRLSSPDRLVIWMLADSDAFARRPPWRRPVPTLTPNWRLISGPKFNERLFLQVMLSLIYDCIPFQLHALLCLSILLNGLSQLPAGLVSFQKVVRARILFCKSIPRGRWLTLSLMHPPGLQTFSQMYFCRPAGRDPLWTSSTNIA